jgi:L-threonylcarbamoyladenylate synthase
VIVPVERAAALLERGELVAYPTETVYGLGADAGSAGALERLLAAKGRERERGVSVLVSDTRALCCLAPELPARALRIAERFWPGPLTLVVACADARLSGVASERGVGFRCSPQPTAAALVRALGRPVASTSCNKSGDSPCCSAADVEAVFGCDLAIAGGEAAGGAAPSTVIAVTPDGGVELLREGDLPLERILEETRA